MSILSQIGTKLGSEIKNLDIRLSSAETAIVNLGGQQPPPTGNFTISPVTWTNLSEIDLGGYIADPDNDGSSRGSGLNPIKLIALTDISFRGTIMPQGTLLHGVGGGGSTNDLIRMEDPDDPRDYPYTAGNQWTGTWDWELFADRGTTWEFAKENKIVSGGSVQTFTGGSIEKISGVDGYNSGASSVQKIDGQSNGYVQFQIGTSSKSVRLGLVELDSDFEVDPPFQMNFGGGTIDLYSPWLSNYETYESGDWFRIRHYSANNEIHFQKKQNVVDSNGVLLGQDYVTFYTHPTFSNGNDLYFDTSFHTIGSRINDVQMAI